MGENYFVKVLIVIKFFEINFDIFFKIYKFVRKIKIDFDK